MSETIYQNFQQIRSPGVGQEQKEESVELNRIQKNNNIASKSFEKPAVPPHQVRKNAPRDHSFQDPNHGYGTDNPALNREEIYAGEDAAFYKGEEGAIYEGQNYGQYNPQGYQQNNNTYEGENYASYQHDNQNTYQDRTYKPDPEDSQLYEIEPHSVQEDQEYSNFNEPAPNPPSMSSHQNPIPLPGISSHYPPHNKRESLPVNPRWSTHSDSSGKQRPVSTASMNSVQQMTMIQEDTSTDNQVKERKVKNQKKRKEKSEKHEDFSEPTKANISSTSGKPTKLLLMWIFIGIALLTALTALLIAILISAEVINVSPACNCASQYKAPACPYGWVQHGSSCYGLASYSTEQETAMRQCSILGARILSIENEEEMRFIQDEIICPSTNVAKGSPEFKFTVAVRVLTITEGVQDSLIDDVACNSTDGNSSTPCTTTPQPTPTTATKTRSVFTWMNGEVVTLKNFPNYSGENGTVCFSYVNSWFPVDCTGEKSIFYCEKSAILDIHQCQ